MEYKETPILLVVHKALLIESHFKWNTRLRDLNAAQKWGINDPAQFDNLPKQSKIEIIAWYEVNWRINAIQAYDQAEKQRQEAEQNSRRKH